MTMDAVSYYYNKNELSVYKTKVSNLDYISMNLTHTLTVIDTNMRFFLGE